MHTSGRKPVAFSLIELLVVVGIIAVLLGVLMPLLSGVQRRGRTLKCQSNLRSIVQLVHIYAAENKGSLPYGWYYNHSDPLDWTDVGGDRRVTTCFSIFSKMSSRHYKGDDVFLPAHQVVNPQRSQNNYAAFLRCPEAEQVGAHICSYAVQFSAFVTPRLERIIAGNGPIQDRPAKISDLMPFTILLHDTAIHLPGMSQEVGFVSDGDVDDQSFWHWNAQPCPQRRYYDPSDPYSHYPTASLRRFGNNQPVLFNFNSLTHPFACSQAWYNIDPPPVTADGFNGYPYQGNVRYRHGKNDVANVGYADGRVESVKAILYPDGRMQRSNLPRKSFMIKWPKGMGIQPNPSMP